MPRIPVFHFQRKATTEGQATLMDTRSFGMEQMAAARSWENLGDMGLALSRVGRELTTHINHAQQVDDLSEMKLTSTLKFMDLKTRVKEGADPDQYRPVFEEQTQKIYDETLKKSSDPLVQAHFKTHWSNLMVQGMQDVIAAARETKIKKFAGDFEKRYPQYVGLYSQAGNDIERDKIKSDLFDMIAGAQAAGFITPQKAEVARQNFAVDAAKTRVIMDMRQDPWGTYERLKQADSYEGLAPAMAIQLQGQARMEIHRRQEENAAALEKQYQENQLNLPGLKAMFDQGKIRPGTYRLYEAALLRDQAPVKAEKNLELYNSLFNQAYDKKLQMDSLYDGVKSGAVSFTDAKELIRMNARRVKGETPKPFTFIQDPWFKLSMAEIDARLKPLEGVLGIQALKPGAKQPMPRHQAAYRFMEECKAAQEQGTLNGAWMWQRANEIIKPFEMMGAKGVKTGAPVQVNSFGERMPGEAPPMAENPFAIPRPSETVPLKGPKPSQQVPWR